MIVNLTKGVKKAMMKLVLFTVAILAGLFFHFGWYFIGGVVLGCYIGNMKK
jgi:hypothetical protein